MALRKASYSHADRMSSVSVDSVAVSSYNYNPFGQRISKTFADSTQEIYHYDEAGQLISVSDGSGNTLREYIYLESQQVAFVNNGTLYYIHNDHLNTPQVVTDQNQQVVWMADYQPFGKLVGTQMNSIELYSRFPGQYLDSESGLYYNYFRDYDPSVGRYIQSDPIGLSGGFNTYAYVEGNPIKYIDPFGLQTTVDTWCRRNPVACADILDPALPKPQVTPVAPATPVEQDNAEQCPPEDPNDDG